jgi:hypothetical protein
MEDSDQGSTDKENRVKGSRDVSGKKKAKQR